MTAPRGNYSFPTKYRIGCGRRRELAKFAASLGISRALVVTDAGVAGLPWFGETLDGARAEGLPVEVFSGVKSNPVEANVTDALAAYRAADCDGVIAVGGGSALDAGKCVALMAGHDGSVFDYEFADGKWKNIRYERVAPVLAMPTTSGTGSECSNGAVITDVAAGVKRTFAHPAFVPRGALCDPETTFALPAKLTAATGMDAVTHCIEALCAPGYHPMADGIALEGLRLLDLHLRACVKHPSDAEARTHVMMAASMAAVAFQKGLGLVHAMAHPAGAVTDIHHGLANAILLPYCLHHNRPAIEEHCHRLARYLGLAVAGYDGVLQWVLQLRAELGIPHTLAAAGVPDDGLADVLAPKAAAETMYLSTNPRPVTVDELRAIYQRSIDGEL